MYSVKAYFLAKQFLEIPPALLIPTFSMLMVYWSVGFSSQNNPQEIF
jgi:ATP-binding cassette, subfamily G (WHITE), eye pigment precursor transporter